MVGDLMWLMFAGIGFCVQKVGTPTVVVSQPFSYTVSRVGP